MPLRPKTFQEVYDLIKNRIQARFPDEDFLEGSFNDILAGAYATAYDELQSLMVSEFSKTFFRSDETTGIDLERLAVDHFGSGAARPASQPAVGVITITRGSGNTGDIIIPSGYEFMSGEVTFTADVDTTILGATNSGAVFVTASQPGVIGNVPAGSDWSSGLDNVTITNDALFQGGQGILDDAAYRIFITNFIASIQDGTKNGIEGAARNVSGVDKASLLRKLVDVGTLGSDGNLEGSPSRFKAVRVLLYLSGSTGIVNDAVKNKAEEIVKQQLSSGEFLEIFSAVPISVDIDATLTFATSSDAIALSQRRSELERAFEQQIIDLNIGESFDRDSFIDSVIATNGWSGFFTGEINRPAGDVDIDENQKAVPRNIIIEVK